MRTVLGPGQAPGLTFAQDVDGVALAEVQVLWSLSSVVVQRHHLVLDGPVLQGVFCLLGGTVQSELSRSPEGQHWLLPHLAPQRGPTRLCHLLHADL